MGRKKKINYSLIKNQPEKCKGCIWGSWRETKQYCSRVRCVKDDEMDNKTNQKNITVCSATTAKKP